MRLFFALITTIALLQTSACGSEGNAAKDGDYETTKKMVVDIFQTEEGKKALRELMADEEMKKHLVIESDIVQDSIANMLASDKGAEMWSNFFKDPTFVEDYAKSMADEQKKLMKSLMNDAEFQKQMIEILQNPEINDQMLTILKGQQFRSHLEDTIQQTLETPLFQSKMTEVLLKAAEKQQQKEKTDESKQSGQDESGGGSQGDGEGSSNAEG